MPDKTCKIDDLPVLKLDYNLPENLIAQKPIEKRDESRMMLCDRKTGTIEHHIFRELTDILPESTLIVRNITRVFPARVEGVKETGGKIEILFLREIDPGLWRVIFSRRARMPEGRKIFLFNSEITGTLVERIEDGEDVLKIDNPGLFNSLIKVHGKLRSRHISRTTISIPTATRLYMRKISDHQQRQQQDCISRMI
jgi:S-adenosylmethionine:tRNA ribosyltransferase-isomerase